MSEAEHPELGPDIASHPDAAPGSGAIRGPGDASGSAAGPGAVSGRGAVSGPVAVSAAGDAPEPAQEESGVPWSRLDPRMLLVHPMRELIRFLPIILIGLIAGAASGHEPWWTYAASGLGIVVGIGQYLTTSYRITETHVQVRRGILNRKLLSAPRERIRSVDVDSTVLHRIFGLSVVKVGTGVSRGRNELEFNALATKDVPALRRELLSHVGAAVTGSGGDAALRGAGAGLRGAGAIPDGAGAGLDGVGAGLDGVGAGLDGAGASLDGTDASLEGAGAGPVRATRGTIPAAAGVGARAASRVGTGVPGELGDRGAIDGGAIDGGAIDRGAIYGSAIYGDQPRQNISHWRPGWVRFAPFTLSGVASIFVVVAFLFQIQFFDDGMLTRLPVYSTTLHRVSRLPLAETVAWGLVVLIVVASVVAIVRYALSYGRFTIGRIDDYSLHISHGLLRIRQVTLDERRLRGISLSEPLSLRAVRGATTHAIMTGLGRERGGVALLSPPGPAADALSIAAEVLGTDEPLTCELATHGPRATRRRYTRALLGVLVLAAIALWFEFTGVVTLAVWWAFAGIVPAAGYLAYDRSRRLGHALIDGWLVTRSGSLNEKRSILAVGGIIGWTVRRSYFQRRAGLATLIATTAAGRHKYEILDLPEDEVWPLIERVSLRRAPLDRDGIPAGYVLPA